MDIDEKQYTDHDETQNVNDLENGPDSREQAKDSPVPTDRKTVLAGMFREWYLEYASYVILERAVPHIEDGLKPVQRLTTAGSTRWPTWWETPCSITLTATPRSEVLWCSSARRNCLSTRRVTGVTS